MQVHFRRLLINQSCVYGNMAIHVLTKEEEGREEREGWRGGGRSSEKEISTEQEGFFVFCRISLCLRMTLLGHAVTLSL